MPPLTFNMFMVGTPPSHKEIFKGVGSKNRPLFHRVIEEHNMFSEGFFWKTSVAHY